MKILIDCTLDVVFKTIFKSKNTRFYVASIISEFLNLNYDYVYQNMQILDGELPKDNLKEKGKISDCIVKIDNQIIIFEMNRENYDNLRENKLRYLTTVFNNNFKVGKKFLKNKIILFNINAFKENSESIENYKLRSENEIYTKYIRCVNINLEKVKEKWYNKFTISKLEKYLLYLLISKNEEEIKELIKGEKVLMKLEKEREKLSLRDQLLYGIDYEEEKRIEDNLKKETYLRIGREEGKEVGQKEGRAEGEVIGARKTTLEKAKLMLENGIDIKLIEKIMGLSEKEIKSLQ